MRPPAGRQAEQNFKEPWAARNHYSEPVMRALAIFFIAGIKKRLRCQIHVGRRYFHGAMVSFGGRFGDAAGGHVLDVPYLELFIRKGGPRAIRI